MDYRITEAYAQLAKLYSAEARKCEDDKGNCPDRIYIFGFSRGALIARALAGLVSYAGLPKVDGSARSPEDYRRLATAINDYTKGIDDAAATNFWKTWRPGSAPPLAKDIGRMKIDRKVFKEIALEPVQIQFVGLWDTVPGTFFKNFGVCIEESDKKSGTRYKTNTYPTIGHIAHAVSQDEKRGRFELLHICEPLQPEHTTTHEAVFPGAHSDIGGGYADLPKDNCAINKCVTALPNISMVWMLDELIAAEEKLEKKKDPKIIDLRHEFSVHADAAGVAHWSLAGFKNKATNFCRDREWDWEKRHAGANADLPRGVRWELHKAIKDRGEKALIKHGDEVGVEPKLLPYPPKCSVYK